MMQIRCQYCAWLSTLGLEAIALAVAEAQARQETSHTISCQQCGNPINLDVAELQQLLPTDYVLPQVKPSPLPIKAADVPPPPSKASPKWNIAVVPQWDPNQKRQVTQWAFRLSVMAVVVAWIVTLVWLFRQPIVNAPTQPLPAGIDLAVALAPVLAAAAGIERFLETIFGITEHNWRTLVAYLGHGLRWLRSAETEVQQARKWLADVSSEASDILKQIPYTPEQLQTMIPDQLDQGKTLEEWRAEVVANAQRQMDMANNLIALAEKRLSDAECELASAVSSPSYKNVKRAASIVLGLWLGLIVATASQLQMFAMLGIDVAPARVDVLVTGLVIGSGSYPVHSLVGLLQQAKDTLESTQKFLKDKGEQARSTFGG